MINDTLLMDRDSRVTPKAVERTDTGCYTKIAYRINCRLLEKGRAAGSIAYDLSQISFHNLDLNCWRFAGICEHLRTM